ncbi:hypothetical protein K2173_015282 [Erythroxylum novogranatense]|uniref:Uncharacterized protein n=1 Tax=Erythroxylum novogranatense TaxID=1862640 RepID=A0AAV8T1G9_9ROSI|nr:hypothetical protein K2173_015282 [Erythroxylum novogranatense]
MSHELYSLAYYSSSLYNSSIGWDLQNLGVLNADMSLVMDGITPSPFLSSLETDLSTGYLEDAVLEFNERSKRRRLLLYAHNDQNKVSNDLAKSYWNANYDWKMPENFSFCISRQNIGAPGISDEIEPISTSVSETSEEANFSTEIRSPEMEISAPEALDSSSSSYKVSSNTKSLYYCDKERQLSTNQRHNLTNNSGGEKGKKRMITRVVYPFAMVKPGGVEGDMTINDINERNLMPPTRPVRHPVGDFACRPCVSADGPGLSGKAVVALTRIHTQGRRGTITIIRTKG